MAIVTLEGQKRTDSLFKELQFGRRANLLLIRFCLCLATDRQEKHTNTRAEPDQAANAQAANAQAANTQAANTQAANTQRTTRTSIA